MTHLAAFQSNDAVVAAVDADGRIKAGPLPGEAAVMARFMNQFAVCNVLIPLPGGVDPSAYAALPRKNFIDGHVWAKLQRLGVTPSDSAPATSCPGNSGSWDWTWQTIHGHRLTLGVYQNGMHDNTKNDREEEPIDAIKLIHSNRAFFAKC